MPRRLFTMVSEQVYDRHGRLLAYVATSYTAEERRRIPESERPTFNLQMLQDGHAISLLIFPNVPKPSDLELVRDAVSSARRERRGFWADPILPLHAYEYRWIVDVTRGRRAGPDRYCGNFITEELYRPAQYYRVPEESRLWFFAEHLSQALKIGFKLA